MYRVLIVDDEEPVLDSYSFLIKNTEEFVVVGTARTGYEAHELINKLNPDLVFMDINIPGMDGIQVITEVYRKFPAMVFILSTAYERFDLAQRALPLGVFAYLVKPVSKKAFLDTLNAVKENLSIRPQRSIGLDEEDFKQNFFRKAIWHAMNKEEWSVYRERFSFTSDNGIVCHIDVEQDAEKWFGVFAEKLALKYLCQYDTFLNRGIFLISEDVDRSKFEKQLLLIFKEVFPPTLFYSYGLGQVHKGPEIYLSCNQALEDLRKKQNMADVRLRERLRIIQLRRKIGIADPNEVRQLFKALWEEVFNVYNFVTAKAKMASIFMLLIDDCTGSYSGHTEELPPFNPHEEIMGIENMDVWNFFCERTFEDLLKRFTVRRSDKFPPPLSKAVEFIHENYIESIQLGLVADAACVAPSYLSRLFSEHLNTTFIDYVTELRINHAERLIRESKMSIKEVAYAVGYQDPNYFSKLFRKATGFPPTVYAAEKRGSDSNV